MSPFTVLSPLETPITGRYTGSDITASPVSIDSASLEAPPLTAGAGGGGSVDTLSTLATPKTPDNESFSVSYLNASSQLLERGHQARQRRQGSSSSSFDSFGSGAKSSGPSLIDHGWIAQQRRKNTNSLSQASSGSATPPSSSIARPDDMSPDLLEWAKSSTARDKYLGASASGLTKEEPVKFEREQYLDFVEKLKGKDKRLLVEGHLNGMREASSIAKQEHIEAMCAFREYEPHAQKSPGVNTVLNWAKKNYLDSWEEMHSTLSFGETRFQESFDRIRRNADDLKRIDKSLAKIAFPALQKKKINELQSEKAGLLNFQKVIEETIDEGVAHTAEVFKDRMINGRRDKEGKEVSIAYQLRKGAIRSLVLGFKEEPQAVGNSGHPLWQMANQFLQDSDLEELQSKLKEESLLPK